jgi:hypothetical protein
MRRYLVSLALPLIACSTAPAETTSAGGATSSSTSTSSGTGGSTSSGAGGAGTGGSNVGGAPAGPIDTVIDAMAEGSWKKLTGTPMNAVCPMSVNHYLCDAVMNAWSGGAFDSARDRLIIHGGGHDDSFYNNVFTFDLATMTWARHTELPAPLDNLPDGAQIPPVYRDKRVETCGLYPSVSSLNIPDAWLGPTGYLQFDKCDDPTILAQLDEQQPRSAHSYGNVAYSPKTGEFFVLGNTAPYPSGQDISPRVMSFDFKSKKWSRKGDHPGVRIGGCSATGADGTIYSIRDGALYSFEPVTGVWTELPNGQNAKAYYAGAAVDTKRNQLFVTANGVDLERFDLTAQGALSTIQSTGLSGPLNGQLGFEYVASIDRFVAWDGGKTVHYLNPETHVWTSVDGTGDDPGAFPGNGIWGRFRVSPTRHVLVLATATNQDVLIFKLPSKAQ